MDDPELEAVRFVASLRGLRRVNAVTGSARVLRPALEEAARAKKDARLRVLDIACGGGDVAIALSKSLNARGIAVDIFGCDLNPLAVEHASVQAERGGADVSFFVADAVSDPISPDFDVIMTSLFLHHLSEEDAIAFLKKAAESAREMLLIHDLVRSRAGYLLAQVGVRVLLCNGVCHEDGPRSVEGAFTIPEVQNMAEAAGLTDCSIEPRFPYRFLLKWMRP